MEILELRYIFSFYNGYLILGNAKLLKIVWNMKFIYLIINIQYFINTKHWHCRQPEKDATSSQSLNAVWLILMQDGCRSNPLCKNVL